MNKSLYTILGIVLSVVATGLYSYFNQQSAEAVTAKDWNASNIITDAEFTKKSSMSADQIRSWLNARLINCDPNGLKKSELRGGIDYDKNGTITRSEWGRAAGNGGKFTCLNKYYEVPKTVPKEGIPASNYGGKAIPSGAKSAARLIYDAAQAYNINPKVLLVKLATESAGPLTSDTWPLRSQYTYAMGAHCPDSGPGGSANCDTRYSGFSIQMREAAKLMRAYLDNMDQPWYGCSEGNKKVQCAWNRSSGSDPGGGHKVPYTNNFILWNVRPSGCSGKTIYIANKATAALYTYTPYQPNAAALNNMYGTGDRCSAYGNRNFWRVYSDWFGSTRNDALKITRGMYNSPGDLKPLVGESTAVSFVIKNISDTTQTIDSIGVAVRDSSNAVYNYPFKSLTLAPGQSYEYYERQTFSQPGQYRMWIAYRLPSGEWSSDYPQSINTSISRSKNINVVGVPNLSISRSMFYSPTSNPTSASTEDITAVSFKVTNNDTRSNLINEMRVAAKHESGAITYYPSVKNHTLQPGQEYEYYQYANLPKAGNYDLSIEFKLPNGSWSSSWPSASGTTLKQRSVNIVNPPNVTISRDLFVSPNPILVGQTIGSSFIVKNNGSSAVIVPELKVRATNSKGVVFDFPSVNNISLDPGEEYLYYQYRVFENVDNYTFFPVARVATSRQTKTWPLPDNGVIIERKNSSRLPRLTLTRSMYNSPGNKAPRVGDSTVVSFVLRNDENRTIDVPSIVVAVRNPANKVVNYPFVHNLTLKAGESYQYYQQRSFDDKGLHRMWIATALPQGGWSSTWPETASRSLVRGTTIDVR